MDSIDLGTTHIEKIILWVGVLVIFAMTHLFTWDMTRQSYRDEAAEQGHARYFQDYKLDTVWEWNYQANCTACTPCCKKETP